jgi:hypothetical protein
MRSTSFVLLPLLASLSGCSADEPPLFCRDSRSVVVQLFVGESDAPAVSAVEPSGSGCQSDAVTCASEHPDGSCSEYRVEVSLGSGVEQGSCSILVSYRDGQPGDLVAVDVSLSHCGAIAGVDGVAQYDLPIGSGGAGGSPG